MFHGGHQLQKVAFQLEIRNTTPPDSIGQPKTNYKQKEVNSKLLSKN